MAISTLKKLKRKDQDAIQNDLIKNQGKRKEQEDEDINNNDDAALYIWMREHQAFYWSVRQTFK